MVDLTPVAIGIGSALAVALIQSTIGPLVEWWVNSWERRKERKERLIQEWREMVGDVWRQVRILSLYGEQGDEVESKVADAVSLKEAIDKRYQLLEYPITREVLMSDERFLSLRPRLSERAIRELKESETPNLPRGRMPKVLKTVSEEVDRIESDWGLTGNE